MSLKSEEGATWREWKKLSAKAAAKLHQNELALALWSEVNLRTEINANILRVEMKFNATSESVVGCFDMERNVTQAAITRMIDFLRSYPITILQGN